MTAFEHFLLVFSTVLVACTYALVVLGCFTDRRK